MRRRPKARHRFCLDCFLKILFWINTVLTIPILGKANPSSESYFVIALPPTKLLETNCDRQGDIKDNSNVITDINSVTAIHSCVNNSVTDITNHVIIFFKFFFFEKRYRMWIINVCIEQKKTHKFLYFWAFFLTSSYTFIRSCKYKELDI